MLHWLKPAVNNDKTDITMNIITRLILIMPVAATDTMGAGMLMPTRMLTHSSCAADVCVVMAGKRNRCAINEERFFVIVWLLIMSKARNPGR